MDYQVKFLAKIFKISIVATGLFGLALGGLFLNLKNAGATGDSNPPSFPSCSSQTGAGDVAHYESGLHQIPGNGVLEGKDDVYSLSSGNFLQCFRNEEVCIQSNWWRTDQELDGWLSLNGEQWNLGSSHFLVKNVDCEPEPSPSPSPSPIPSPEPSPSPVPQGGQDQGQSQEQNQEVNVDVNVEQKQENNQTVNITVPQVQAAAVTGVPVKQPDTGVGVLGMASMAGAGPLGLLLARYGRGRAVGKREEDLSEIGFNLTEKRKEKNLV